MRILVLDHFFEQDIEALVSSGQGKHEFKKVSYEYFANRAHNYLPEAVFSGLYEYHKPIYEEARKRWASAAKMSLFELYQIYPFDVMVSPSDTFCYIRDVIQAAKDLGVPFIVVQTETTISPDTMEFLAIETGRLFPFISDYMTVCSERHKEFWIRGGAPPDKIAVTGQPRFDFYSQPDKWLKLEQLRVPLDASRKTILFFSYDLGAYLPCLKVNSGASWRKLREETEYTLVKTAKKDRYNLLVKPHPQQDTEDIERVRVRLQKLSDAEWLKSVFLIPSDFDTRQLIVNADIVVGFQTTALLEALALGKNVIYTFWTDEVHAYKDALIPYHEYSDILMCARSAKELEYNIKKRPTKIESDRLRKRRLEFLERNLGPMDGEAAAKDLRTISRVVRKHSKLTGKQRRTRAFLEATAHAYRSREIKIARFELFFWWALMFLAAPIRNSRFSHFAQEVGAIVVHKQARLAECEAASGYRSFTSDTLIGGSNEMLISKHSLESFVRLCATGIPRVLGAIKERR